MASIGWNDIEKGSGLSKEQVNELFKATVFRCTDKTCRFNGKHFGRPFECHIKKVTVGATDRDHWCYQYEEKEAGEA